MQPRTVPSPAVPPLTLVRHRRDVVVALPRRRFRQRIGHGQVVADAGDLGRVAALQPLSLRPVADGGEVAVKPDHVEIAPADGGGVAVIPDGVVVAPGDGSAVAVGSDVVVIACSLVKAKC